MHRAKAQSRREKQERMFVALSRENLFNPQVQRPFWF